METNPVDAILTFDEPPAIMQEPLRKADPYVRIECVKLAIASLDYVALPADGTVIDRAKSIAEFVEGGTVVDLGALAGMVEPLAGLVAELPGWVSSLLSNLIGSGPTVVKDWAGDVVAETPRRAL